MNPSFHPPIYRRYSLDVLPLLQSPLSEGPQEPSGPAPASWESEELFERICCRSPVAVETIDLNTETVFTLDKKIALEEKKSTANRRLVIFLYVVIAVLLVVSLLVEISFERLMKRVRNPLPSDSPTQRTLVLDSVTQQWEMLPLQ